MSKRKDWSEALAANAGYGAPRRYMGPVDTNTTYGAQRDLTAAHVANALAGSMPAQEGALRVYPFPHLRSNS